MNKFGRNYRLFIDAIDNQTVGVSLPFTVEFDITRNVLSSANTSSIKIYNLSEETRNRIYKDKFAYNVYRGVELRAGYGQNISTIFKGNVSQCFSVRTGVNFISTIEGFDGGFALVNGQTATSFAKDTPVESILDSLAKSMPNVSTGAMGNFPGKTVRGNTYSGNTADLLKQLTGQSFFIDNERVYFLGDSECIRGAVQVITSDSGLLGTPVRNETYINFDMVFEPRLLIGQSVELRSSTAKNFNGVYKVISLHHRGTISESVAGTAITSVGLLFGPKQLTTVN